MILSSSPRWKNGQVKPLPNSLAVVNQFQVSRELLGDYLSSHSHSVGEASVIPESTFDDVVAVYSPLASFATGNDWIVYSRRKQKGKGKLINEVGSHSSSLSG